jgi:ribosomal protein S27AE
MGIKAPAAAEPSAPASATAVPPEAAQPIWPLALIAAGAVVLAAAITALLWRRRQVAPAGRFCPKCGHATQAANRFCANCGAALH